jgi:hypothetical protein
MIDELIDFDPASHQDRVIKRVIDKPLRWNTLSQKPSEELIQKGTFPDATGTCYRKDLRKGQKLIGQCVKDWTVKVRKVAKAGLWITPPRVVGA